VSNKTPDSGILEIALEAGEVIITHDLLRECWEQIEEPLANGAFVVIETESVRVRMLPILKP